jgi:Big-like domain-containing protein
MSWRPTMTRPSLVTALLSLLLLFGAAVPSAHAVLERVGPTNPATGFPQWYQDKTGVAMEFCSPLNATELDGGWCVLFTGDTSAPEQFPSVCADTGGAPQPSPCFADEHFYYAADAIDRRVANPAAPGTTFLAFLRLGVEGAFLNGPVVPGDQMVFARLRIKINPVPFDGTYTVYTPAGKFVFPDLLASDPRGLFFTNDVGLSAGVFTDALNGDLGPFLVPSAVPGGAEMAPLTAANPTPDTDPAHFGGALVTTPYPVTGKSYIGDPARLGPVTGGFCLVDGTSCVIDPATNRSAYVTSSGLRNPNVFRIEVVRPGATGPVVLFETFDFGVRGRLYTDTIPGRVTVNRASYAQNAAGLKLDVYVTGFETVQGRLPANPAPPVVTPQLSFFDAPCGGTVDPVTSTISAPFTAPTAGTETQIVNRTGSLFWAQAHPPAVPAAVCVKDAAARDANGVVIAGGAFFPKDVTDEVTITQALFNPNTNTITVAAKSSDETTPPLLSLPLLGGGEKLSPATWTLPLPSGGAPPEKVKVLSSAFGSNDYQVSTDFHVVAVTTPVAVADSVTTAEDTAVTINVLANDQNAAGGTVSLVAAPVRGTAVVNANGTVTYTPALNLNGADAFTYKVTVGPQVSNVANVVVNVTPVNDPPVANPDILNATANIPTTLDVLANDTDPDGSADLVAVANVSAVTPAAGTVGTATAVANGRTVTFTATAAGSYTFTYQARDAATALSGPATVTVTVSAQETITIARAQFVSSRYRVDGTITPATGQTMTIQLINSAGTVLRTDTVPSPAGAWAVDIKPFTLPAGANRVVVRSSNGTVATLPLTIK